jgi:membrane protein DedA with SNARE-associated domain
MDFLLNNDMLSHWLIQYGSIALFLLLVSGIIILPIPEETLMILAGVLMSNGKLSIPSTIIAAYAGSICGISVSYILGYTAGHYLISRYGGWIGIKEKQLQQVHNWFERLGKWALMIGYFIPGVRHFTGFVSGMSYMDFKQFALFAYSGAIIWVSIFLSLGYFFGNFAFSILDGFEIDIDERLMIFIVILIVLYILSSKFNLFSYFKSK